MKFSISQLHRLGKIHKEIYPDFVRFNYEFCEGYILVNRYDSEGRCSLTSFSENDIKFALERNKLNRKINSIDVYEYTGDGDMIQDFPNGLRLFNKMKWHQCIYDKIWIRSDNNDEILWKNLEELDYWFREEEESHVVFWDMENYRVLVIQ